MRAKCYCNVRVTSVRDASWVEELNGVSRPFCTTACHERWLQKNADRLEAEVSRIRQLPAYEHANEMGD